MIIYRILNTLNGKSYIGFTSRKINERWKEHYQDARRGCNNCRKFHNAIRKYGKDVWEKTILYEGTDKVEVLKMETHFIKVFNSVENGYNITQGGESGNLGLKMPESFGKSISERQTGKNNPCYGKIYTPEDRKAHSEKLKKWHSENTHPNKGRKAKPETRKLMSESRRGEKNAFFGRKHSEETKRRFSENNPMKNKWGWMNPCTASNLKALETYSKADQYYHLWLKNGKPGSDKLCNLSGEKRTKPHLNIIEKFRKGWIPEKDERWLKDFKCVV